MNKKILLIFIAISLFMTMFFSSCSQNTNDLPKETMKATESSPSPAPVIKLPENYTVDKIKSAFMEYINYRLWLYPSKYSENLSEKSLDNYIGKTIDVEIRVYNNSSEKTVYAHTSAGKWLAFFNIKNGFVYCDGQTIEGEYGWPQDSKYEVIEKYSIAIPEPHKPNYGTSQRKEKMIAAIEFKARDACRRWSESDSTWENVDVFIVDFYEYEMGTHAWLCRQDGLVTDFPVSFVEENNEIKVQTGKGFTTKHLDKYDNASGHLFRRDISDAVAHFKCITK